MAESGDKYELAAKLIEQAPPGQVREVIEELQIIVGDDAHFMPLALKHLAEYNLAQLTVMPSLVDGKKAILSHAAMSSPAPATLSLSAFEGDNARYVDPAAKKSFNLEHTQLGTSDVQEHVIPEDHEAFRSALEKSLSTYLTNHYSSSDSASSVFCSSPNVAPPPAPAVLVTEPPVTEEAPQEPVVEAESEEKKAEEEAGEGGEMKVDEPEKTAEEEAAPPAEEAPKEDEEKPLVTKLAENLDETMSVVKDALTGGDSPPEEHPVKPAEEAALEETPTAPTDTAEEVKSEEPEKLEEPAEESKVEEKAEVVEEEAEEPVPEPVVLPDPVYTLQIVGNKYNQSNFWTGRWRSSYVVNPKEATVQGKINVDVHYFEQGNVQLAASHSTSFPYPADAKSPEDAASEIVTTIAKLEQMYQSDLNDTYNELGEKAFRSLRRALPITRQKVDWDKIGNYKLGGQISK